jgi:hypothetical protein
MADVVPPSVALAFVTKMSEKYKSTLFSAIQVKNQQKTRSTEDTLDVISRLEKAEMLTYTVMFESLIAASINIIFSGTAAQRRLWPPCPRGFLTTRNDAPHSVGLLWTSDQLVTETST